MVPSARQCRQQDQMCHVSDHTGDLPLLTSDSNIVTGQLSGDSTGLLGATACATGPAVTSLRSQSIKALRAHGLLQLSAALVTPGVQKQRDVR